jgi:hypothetical protein
MTLVDVVVDVGSNVIGGIGIALELWGAWLLVKAARRGRESVDDLGIGPAGVNIDSVASGVNFPLKLIRQQHGDQMQAFTLFAIGLSMQLIGGLKVLF